MNFVFAFVAGLLTTLSPCVLPVLPFVTASSLNKNRAGPIALALGLLASFIGVSLLLSASGFALGVDPSIIRRAAGLLLALSGILFLSQRLSDGFATKLSFLSNRMGASSAREDNGSLFAEFVSGALLGVVWTPCSGPSLGAALGLAAQSGNTARAALVLVFFGIGAVIPLMIFAYGARSLVQQMRSHTGAIYFLKKGFGALIVLFGLFIVFGLDKGIEAALTNAMPESWTNLVTRF